MMSSESWVNHSGGRAEGGKRPSMDIQSSGRRRVEATAEVGAESVWAGKEDSVPQDPGRKRNDQQKPEETHDRSSSKQKTPVTQGREGLCQDSSYLGKKWKKLPPGPPQQGVLTAPRVKAQREEEPAKTGPFFYVGGGNGASLVTAYCENKGWQRRHDKARDDYKLRWSETKSKIAYNGFREGEQLLYQIPNNNVLTTKIGLLVSLREYDRVNSKVHHSHGQRRLRMEEFFPETFRMDIRDEREAFFAQLEDEKQHTKGSIWICKPTGLNQGRGIFLLRAEEDTGALHNHLQIAEGQQNHKKIPHRPPQPRIVQRYIQNPLLLRGKKFDVRCYFLIACTTPYMVFFRHGYVRLTCDLYDPNSSNLTGHLTNQYMQKKNPLYSVLKEDTLWSMESLSIFLNQQPYGDSSPPQDWVFGAFTRRMQQIVLHCFLAAKAKLERKLGYFDLIGCDFMVDEDFKVWLLEMNCNPALHTNCQVLKEVVPAVVTETLDLTLEIFTKRRCGHPLLPLASQTKFVLLYREQDGSPHKAANGSIQGPAQRAAGLSRGTLGAPPPSNVKVASQPGKSVKHSTAGRFPTRCVQRHLKMTPDTPTAHRVLNRLKTMQALQSTPTRSVVPRPTGCNQRKPKPCFPVSKPTADPSREQPCVEQEHSSSTTDCRHSPDLQESGDYKLPKNVFSPN